MWDSGYHLLKVVALDEAEVQSTALSGELRYNVNYPPETELIEDSQWPRYTTDGVNWINFAEGDTIPDKAYVQFKQRGVDRLLLAMPQPCPWNQRSVFPMAARRAGTTSLVCSASRM